MGLISALVLLPVAPMRGVLWVAEQITEEVNRQYRGQGAIVQQLRQVDDARAAGELNEEQAAEREQQLLERRLAAPPETGHG